MQGSARSLIVHHPMPMILSRFGVVRLLIFSLSATASFAGALDARHWQLFIDDFAVARSTGLDRIVHHPKPRGVVIANDRPWESKGVAPYYVGRKDDGTFFCIYDAIYWVPDPEGKIVRNGRVQRDRAQQYVEEIAYATSKDGIHWEKPELGLIEGPTGIDWKVFPPFPSPTGSDKRNNLGVPFMLADLGGFGNVTDPAKRYAVWSGGQAYFSPTVPDFIGDPQWRSKLTPTGGTFSTREHVLHFWDDAAAEWVALVQNTTPRWLPSRVIARFASKDLKTWRSDVALQPDSLDSHEPNDYEEPMFLTPFYTEGVVLGTLGWLHTDRTTPDGGPVMAASGGPAKVWPWPTNDAYPFAWPWSRKGPNDMRITISRDGGRTWDRVSSREAWIPHGREEDSYDRLVLKAPSPPVRVGDEDWFYVGVWDGDHLTTRADAAQSTYYHDRLCRGQIALYTQKRNRYVSLRARTQVETLITKPFVLQGDRIQLNVDASRGRVRVAVAEYKPVLTLKDSTLSTDPHLLEQNALPGFGRDDCTPVRTNHIEHTVEFKGGTLDAWRGREVVLFIELHDANLYGFRTR